MHLAHRRGATTMEDLEEVTHVQVQQSSIPSEVELASPTSPVRRKRGRPFLSRSSGGGGRDATPRSERKPGRPFLSRGGGETTPRSDRNLGCALSSDSRFSRLNLPKPCLSAIQSLKVELGLRNADETLRWLLHQFRPGIVPGEPPRPSQNAQESTCMPRPVGDQQVSLPHSPVPAAGDAPAKRTRVRATVVQASTVFLDTPATLDKAERLVCNAAACGSELVVFPEAFVGGYPRCVMFDTVTPTHSTEADDFQKYYAAAIEVPGPEVDKLAKIACKYKVQLVMGVVERCGYYVYSTVLFFDSQGQHIGHHRKLKPMPSESSLWYPGEKSTLPIYETAVGKIGGFICWDNKLPLLRAELYSKGIEMYCAPTADAGEVWKASMTHIAVEGGCFVLSANQFCRRKDYPLPPGGSPCDPSMDAITSAGGSIIISPTGAILAGPNYKGECLISADLDLGEISRARIEVCSQNVGSKHVDGTTKGPNPVVEPAHVKVDVPEIVS